MDHLAPVLLVAAILFAAAFIRSALGFGDALVAMPLLALTVGIQTATPLVAFSAITIALTILVKNWRKVDLKAAWRLILASALGIPVGLLLLKGAPEYLVKALLGALLILFGLFNLATLRLPTIESRATAYIFGFVAGVLGGAYNTNGPPIVVYGALRRWPPERFRATLQGYFFATGLFILTGHALAGLWTAPVLKLYAYSLPPILLAILIGGKLNRSLSARGFERLVYLFLIVIGVFLII
ncbi:MAG: sulfite exporter TauE/SafE family protein [Blastocatellia bacterium]|nr:sulfite exporter TauE/SafE family protein [Blastocatellia bacterium]